MQLFNQRNKQIRVLRTDLVFDNRELIQLLAKRGEAIKFSQQSDVFQTEHQIRQLLQKQYNARVCGVFMTFQDNEDVYKAAKFLNQTGI